MAQINFEYELSLWEDRVENNGDYFGETRIATIGSHSSQSPFRAMNPTLIENINGERTLSFEMVRQYFDSEGEKITNPFLKLLVNERKVKIRKGPEYSYILPTDLDEEDTEQRWSTFVIKEIEEDQDTLINTYIAKEIFVNELGKNGWAVILNTELENNYGTVTQLATKILEGSDWTVDPSSYSPVDYINQPLFKAKLIDSQNFSAHSVIGKENFVIPGGSTIYLFYESLVYEDEEWSLKPDSDFQFIWANKILTSDDTNDDRIIIDELFNFNFSIDSNELIFDGKIQMTGVDQGEETLQGKYIVKNILTHYERNLDRYVQEYRIKNSTILPNITTDTPIYHYKETEIITPNIIENYITNGSNFTNHFGWGLGDIPTTTTLPFPFSDDPNLWLEDNPVNYLVFPLDTIKTYYNEGPTNYRLRLVHDNVYVVRFQGRLIKNDSLNYGIDNENIKIADHPKMQISLGTYQEGYFTAYTNEQILEIKAEDLNDDNTNVDTYGYPKKNLNPRVLRDTQESFLIDEQGYIYTFLTANSSTRAASEKIVLQIKISSTDAIYSYYLKDLQLFDYIEQTVGEETRPLFINDDLVDNYGFSEESFIKPVFYYIKDDLVEYLPTNKDYYEPQYIENYSAVRHIEVAESNYFNNINLLAELFETWVRFDIKHTQNGRILLIDGSPDKRVKFSRYSPNDELNSAGFKCGINLLSTSRIINSEDIATKIIVKNNNQQFAQDGMASISRAQENPTKENEIYNFNYYINQGLLDYSQYLRDFYGYSSDDLNYNLRMKKINISLLEKNELLQVLKREKLIAEEQKRFYQEAKNATLLEIERETLLYSSVSGEETNYHKQKTFLIIQLNAKLINFNNLISLYETRSQDFNEKIKALKLEINSLNIEKEELRSYLYKKYSRFIQEGIWTDENYVDDNLYYLDALKIASTSAFPQINYKIDVIDVQSFEDLSAYAFRIGSRTYVEDTDFFGWVYKNIPGVGVIKTPYKMEVVVSEYTHNFDDPSQSTIIIQNYRNAYDDLFQQLISTTNSLQYASGKQAKIATYFNSTGELSIASLEQAFANNAFTLANVANQSVVWDAETGIEITDLTNNSVMLRLTSEGIFLTTNGGRTWINGISGVGINTNQLTAGQINVNKINLVQDSSRIFRWDEDGLTTYNYLEDGGTNEGRLVRFSQHGIYATTHGLVLDSEIAKADNFQEILNLIRRYSTFSLTWDGLYLQAQQGVVSLTPRDGLEIFNPLWRFPQSTLEKYEHIIDSDGQIYSYYEDEALGEVTPLVPLISLGKFYSNKNNIYTPHYGLRLRNREGIITLQTDQEGNLWLSNLLTVGNKDNKYFTPIESTTTIQVIKYINIDDPNNNYVFFNLINARKKGYINFHNLNIIYLYGEELEELTDLERVKKYDLNFILKETDLAENIILTPGVYTVSYSKPDIENYQFFGLNGLLTDPITHQEYPLVYAGHKDHSKAPFRLSKTGFLEAEHVKISGEINAEQGHFSGAILVGHSSGIDGSANAAYSFWSGITGQEPQFYVTSTGQLVAQQAHIRGEGYFKGEVDVYGNIRAESGIISNSLFFDDIYSNSFIGRLKDQDFMAGSYSLDYKDILLNINNLSFAVDDRGVMYGKTVALGHVPNWAIENVGENVQLINNYAILIGDIATSNNVIEIFNSNSLYSDKYANKVFAVNKNDGSVWINGTLSTEGDLRFKGNLVSYDGQLKIYGGNENIPGSIIAGVPEVDGWGIHSDGSAIFNNVVVRGELESVVFSHKQTSAVGGEILITPSLFLKEDVEGVVNNINQTVVFDLEFLLNIEENNPWLHVTNVRVNIFSQDYTVPLVNYSITLPYHIQTPAGVVVLDELPQGTQIISEATDINSLRLSAIHPGGGLIIAQGPSNEPSTVIIGNLYKDFISPKVREYFGEDNLGYGLLAENAYLTGKLYLPNAGITNEGNDSNSIRFWAGTNPSNREDAPFRVTHDGSLYAKKGIFEGQIKASDSEFDGYIKTAGIVIDEEGPGQFNHFYVSNPFDSYDSPNPHTYIIDIDKEGLKIWEGGLQVFSDYYSGWRENDYIAEKIYSPYGYSDIMINPWPLLKILDERSADNHIPRLSMVHSHVWFKETGDKLKSTKILPSQINFTEISSTEKNYDIVEENLWLSNNYLTIGLTEIEGKKVYGIRGPKVVIGDIKTTALTVEPVERIINDEVKNISKTTIFGQLFFSENISVSQETDGIIFTYIGEE